MKVKKMASFLVRILSSVFFIGYLPLVPGTFGSLVGVGLFYLLRGISPAAYLLFTGGIIGLGLLVSGRTERLLNKKDPSCIVIDEVAGMLLGLSFLPLNLKTIFLAFLVFRIFDTLKPYPASRFQNSHGSIGVMADDLVAGVYTNLVLRCILLLALIF